MKAIPVIDVAALYQGDPATAVAAIHDAGRSAGFFYALNHRIDASLIDRARAAALTFFRRPEAEKQRLAVDADHRGYLAVGGAKMDDDALPDLKQSYLWGQPPSAAEIAAGVDTPFRSRNRWPDDLDLETSALAFFDAAQTLARQLLRGFALGAGLAEDAFLAGSEQPISRGSFVYYPPAADAPQAQFGVAPHTDFGVLTVLSQDDVGGLQVRLSDGDWVDVAPRPDALVVNVGDLLSRWSGGYYRSAPHRVRNQSGRERLSIVCAYDPAFDTLIDPGIMATERLATPRPSADPIRCGDYLNWRFAKAFHYRTPANQPQNAR